MVLGRPNAAPVQGRAQPSIRDYEYDRDLETLLIDAATSDRLIPLIPAAIIAIAESGVCTRADVERYADVGADAVLVGSSLSAAADPVAATRAIAAVPRRPRAG